MYKWFKDVSKQKDDRTIMFRLFFISNFKEHIINYSKIDVDISYIKYWSEAESYEVPHSSQENSIEQISQATSDNKCCYDGVYFFCI